MSTDSETRLSDIPGWLRVFVAFSLICAAGLIFLYFWHFRGGFDSNQGTWGQFGDYVGGILNPLFALTALFALLYTIVLQSKELRDSTAQLKKSAAALDAQNIVLTKQAFEATFFQMMTLLNDLVRDLQVPDGHLKLLHVWPGQTPPPGRRRDEATLLGRVSLGNARSGLF